MPRDLLEIRKIARAHAPSRTRFVRNEEEKIARLIPGNNGLIDLDERAEDDEQTEETERETFPIPDKNVVQ